MKTIMDLSTGRFQLLNENGGGWFKYPPFDFQKLVLDYARENVQKELPKEITRLGYSKGEMVGGYVEFNVGELLTLLENDFNKNFYHQIKVPQKIVQKHIKILLVEKLEDNKLFPQGFIDYKGLKKELMLGVVKIESLNLVWYPENFEATERIESEPTSL